MGTYASTYMGCFLKLPVKNTPVTNTYFQKPSGKRSKTRFNSHTGEEYKEMTEIINVKEIPSAYIDDIDGFIPDNFWTPAYCGVNTNKEIVFLPNSSIDNLINADDNTDFMIDLSDLPDIHKLIIKFRRKYKKYIDYYEEKYGNVEVLFGMVHYYN